MKRLKFVHGNIQQKCHMPSLVEFWQIQNIYGESIYGLVGLKFTAIKPKLNNLNNIQRGSIIPSLTEVSPEVKALCQTKRHESDTLFLNISFKAHLEKQDTELRYRSSAIQKGFRPNTKH